MVSGYCGHRNYDSRCSLTENTHTQVIDIIIYDKTITANNDYPKEKYCGPPIKDDTSGKTDGYRDNVFGKKKIFFRLYEKKSNKKKKKRPQWAGHGVTETGNAGTEPN